MSSVPLAKWNAGNLKKLNLLLSESSVPRKTDQVFPVSHGLDICLSHGLPFLRCYSTSSTSSTTTTSPLRARAENSNADFIQKNSLHVLQKASKQEHLLYGVLHCTPTI